VAETLFTDIINNLGKSKVKVTGSGSKTGKQQIEGAPEGITSDKETINLQGSAEFPITENVNFLVDGAYNKFRDNIEYNDNQIFLEDNPSNINRQVGIGINKDGEGFGGYAKYDLDNKKPKFFVGYKKTFADGGLAEEYYGKDKLDWMKNYADQMSFEEYLRYKRAGSFADGGSTNGSGDAAFSAKVKELMDDGYDFGEAVREAMRQGYKKGGKVYKRYKDTNPKYKFINDFLDKLLKGKTGKILTNSVQLAEAINKQLKGKKFYYENGVPMPDIDYKTVHGLILENPKYNKRFVFQQGRVHDAAYQKKLNAAVKAYRKLSIPQKRKMMTGGIGATGEVHKFMKKHGLYRTGKSKYAEKTGRKLVNTQKRLDISILNKALSKAGIKRPPPLKKGEADRQVRKKRKKTLTQIGSTQYEDHLDNYKRAMQRYIGIKPIKTKTGKKILPLDMAHRTSINQLKKLSSKLDPSDLGLDFGDVNKRQIKALENSLTPLYKEQLRLYNKAKKLKTIPESLSKQIFLNNDKIIKTINESPFRERLKPITINPTDLSIKKGSVITDNVTKQLGMGIIDKPMSEIRYSRSLQPGGEYARGTRADLRFPGSVEDATIKANLATQVVEEAAEAGQIKEKDKAKFLKKAEDFVGLKKVEDVVKDDIKVVQKHAASKGFKLNSFAGFMDFAEAGIDLPPAVRQSMARVMEVGGKFLRGAGKAAVVLDPMFAAYDFSTAIDKGASGSDATEYMIKRFGEGVLNLPGLAIGGVDYLKDKALGKETKFETPYELTFARDALEKNLAAMPKSQKLRNIANRDFDVGIGANMSMVDYMDLPASRDEIEKARQKYLKSQMGPYYKYGIESMVEEEPEEKPLQPQGLYSIIYGSDEV
jgi:hypothetical protein